MNKINKFLISSVITFTPAIAFAANKDLKWLIGQAAGYLDIGLKLLMGLAVLMFVYNIVWYFIKPSGGESRADASKYVMWSTIGFFVIFSFWGIVSLLISSFDLDPTPANGVIQSISNLFPNIN